LSGKKVCIGLHGLRIYNRVIIHPQKGRVHERALDRFYAEKNVLSGKRVAILKVSITMDFEGVGQFVLRNYRPLFRNIRFKLERSRVAHEEILKDVTQNLTGSSIVACQRVELLGIGRTMNEKAVAGRGRGRHFLACSLLALRGRSLDLLSTPTSKKEE